MTGWELATGERIAELTGHRDGVTDLALTSDGRYLVSASEDTTVLVWELP